MVRKAFVAFSFAAMAHSAFAQTDSPWLNWVASNSPYGFDITKDGTIWINLAETGARDDYAINADDLREARENRSDYTLYFWVRGYHKLNPKVSYRESKIRYGLSCKSKTILTTTAAYYDGAGNMLFRDSSPYPMDIIPGTYGEEYYRLICIMR